MTLRSALTASAVLVAAASGAYAQDDLAKLQIGDNQRVFPESITSTADGTIYAGSMMSGLIFKGKMGDPMATQWAPPASEGPPSVAGVYADEKSGLLWACYVDLAAFGGGASMPSNLRTYSLADGSLKGTYALPEKSFCNDIATTADGTAYIADTSGARIMRLKPGAAELETWYADASLGGVDGISFAADGAMYINNVMTGKLFRVNVGTDGAATGVTEIATSTPLKGPDGMRFGEDGKLYLAENGAGQIDAITINGDTADVAVLSSGYDTPTAVSKSGDTLFIGEARFSQMQAADPGQFYVYALPLN
jgi:sugar lactone lactonase YvrE